MKATFHFFPFSWKVHNILQVSTDILYRYRYIHYSFLMFNDI